MAANEVPIDLVMRARDEMSAVLDRIVAESDALTISFDNLGKESSLLPTEFSRIIPLSERLASAFDITGKRAKEASGITWDATVNRWRDANNRFISSQEAAAKGFSETDKEVYKYKRAADAASESTEKLGKKMGEATQSSSSFKAGIIAVGNVAADLAMKAIQGIGSAISGVASEMIGGNAEFERYTVQFGVLLGGADNAKKRLAELAEFGAKTPFELPEVVRADKILQSFGLHSEESAKRFGFSGTEIRTIAGDLAAGTGQSFQDITRYLGMFSAGATGEAIARFQELGITTRKELADMGLTFSKSGELTTPVDQAFSVLLEVSKKKFGGMMDAQSKTFEGMMSNLADWRGQTMRLIGEPIFEVLREKLGKVLEFLYRPETQQAIQDFAKNIAESLKTVVTWVETNWPTIEAVVSAVFNAIGFAWNNVLKPILEFAIEIFSNLYNNVDSNFTAMQEKINSVMEFLGAIIKQVLDTIWQLWQDNGSEIAAFIRDTWDSISKIISDVVEIIVTLIQQNMPKIMEYVNSAMLIIKVAFETAWAAIQLVVGTVVETVKGLITAALQFINGDTEGALNTLKNTFYRIWENILSVVTDWVSDIKDAIEEYLGKSGTSIEEIMNGIKAFISNTWTSISNDIDFFVGGIRNRTAAFFQEMRDDITLSFNQTVANIRSALQSAIAAYNSVAPFLGQMQIPNFSTPETSGGGGTFIAPVPIPTGSRPASANVTVNVYGSDVQTASRGVSQGLQRAGFAVTR